MQDKYKLLNIVRKHKIKHIGKFRARCFILLQKFLIRKTDYRFIYHFPKKDYKKRQFILIGDHASRGIYSYTLVGSPNPCLHVVLGRHNLFSKGIFRLLLSLEVIPKSLYQSDFHAMKQMLWAIKNGDNLCFFPEGIQSVSGSTMPMSPGTITFLKQSNVDVILCKSYGAYLCSPRYRKDTAKGPMEFHYEILFSKEELAKKSEEELYHKYLDRFSYNDFAWNQTAKNHYTFKEGNAKGIGGILYSCPKCRKEFGIVGNGNDIVCKECGNRVILDETYLLKPYKDSECPFSTIDGWFKWQREQVRKEILNESFHVSYEADLVTLHYDKLYDEQEYIIGHGTVKIDKNGIRYIGTKDGKTVDILYELENIPSFTFTPEKDNDFYYGQEYLLFRPKEDKVKVVKYMLYVEELHNLNDGLWNQVSRDAYGQK